MQTIKSKVIKIGKTFSILLGTIKIIMKKIKKIKKITIIMKKITKIKTKTIIMKVILLKENKMTERVSKLWATKTAKRKKTLET